MELKAGEFFCKKRVLGKSRSEEGLEGVKCEIGEPVTDVFRVLFAENVRGSNAGIGGFPGEADETTPHVAIREEAQARRPRRAVHPHLPGVDHYRFHRPRVEWSLRDIPEMSDPMLLVVLDPAFERGKR
jgi:hypothetical protein